MPNDPAELTDGLQVELNGRVTQGVKGPDPAVWGEQPTTKGPAEPEVDEASDDSEDYWRHPTPHFFAHAVVEKDHVAARRPHVIEDLRTGSDLEG